MGNIYGDRLNRDEFVNMVVSIIKNCADKGAPTSFSIEGEWGQGKTWIINKIEAKLKNIDISTEYSIEEYNKAKSDYFIIHYNAWEKDYYDEPIIAILSAIVNELNMQLRTENLLTTLGKELGKELLLQLEVVLGALSKKILGFDIVTTGKNTLKSINKLKEDSKIKLKANNPHDNIDSDINQVIEILNKLSQKIPIVFIVDELDRCIPTFTIKTLERLHHVFDKVNRSVIVLSVSDSQLKRSIDKLYGEGSSTHYFKKFIDFRIQLGSGSAEATEVEKKLNEFSRLFDSNEGDTQGKDIINQICEKLLPREFENIIDRAILCHRLVGEDTSTFPQECMMAEIIVQTYWNVCEREGNAYNISPENGNDPKSDIGIALKKYFVAMRNNPNISLSGDGIIFYVVALILKYRVNQRLLVGETLELSNMLSDYYKKYEVYFRMVRMP